MKRICTMCSLVLCLLLAMTACSGGSSGSGKTVDVKGALEEIRSTYEFTDVMDVTADIAKDILSNSRDTGESLRESDTRYQELYKNLGMIEVTAEEKARIEAAYGKAQFGKINGIKIKVVDNARSLDDVLHNDLAASYPEFFSGDISTAEDVFDRMAQGRSPHGERG